MPINKSSSRQYPLVAKVGINYDDPVVSALEDIIDIPASALVVFGNVNVITPFNAAGGDDRLFVGDAANNSRYLPPGVDLTVPGISFLAPTGFKYATADQITGEYTASGAPATQGYVEVMVGYILDSRGHETQPVR